MRALVAFLFFCVVLASAAQFQQQYESKNDFSADKGLMTRQKNVYNLLHHVHQPNIFKDQVSLGTNFKIEDNLDNFSNPDVVKKIIDKYKKSRLPRGRIFSAEYSAHFDEASDLFKVFFYAKDFETFYKTACWAREHVNEQILVYTFSIAVYHRPDCQGLVLPPPYETQPYYFFNSEVIHQAFLVKMQGNADNISPSIETSEMDGIIINSNYSGWYVNYNNEQKLSYLTEDIGWNSFYNNFHLDYPFWMNGKDFNLKKDKRGELFYFYHQQILARYYLERLSNDLGEIPNFSYKWTVKTGFYPSLNYFNGMEFPYRPNNFNFKQEGFLKHLIQIEDYESRIREAIDLGYLITKNGSTLSLKNPEDIENLAAIVESTADSPFLRYYRYPLSLAKRLLGNSFLPLDKYQLAPSALEQYQTALRDPMFYQLFKRYVGFFVQFKDLLQPYTEEELVVPGVKIENVDVEKMITYFDHFDADITNVVYQNKDEVKNKKDELIIKARQNRLNHKPFTVTTNVFSEKSVKVMVRFFLGPKFDGKGNKYPINDNRFNYLEMDQFIYELKSGKNVIERNSDDFTCNIKDWTSSRHIYQKVIGALAGEQQFTLNKNEAHNGYPLRLLLPRGKKGGMPFNFFVVVGPYEAMEHETISGSEGFTGVGSGARVIDAHASGFPFDRPIDESYFPTKNMYFKEVVIFHKKENEVNQVTSN